MVTEIVAQPLEPSSSKKHGLLVITAPVSPNAVQKGNQGTAIVARKLTSFPSAYSSAPSGQPSSCNTAYFRCAPRKLSLIGDGRVRLEIKVFERHPYTRQAFFPMGRAAEQRSYVVVVAEDNGTFMKACDLSNNRWQTRPQQCVRLRGYGQSRHRLRTKFMAFPYVCDPRGTIWQPCFC